MQTKLIFSTSRLFSQGILFLPEVTLDKVRECSIGGVEHFECEDAKSRSGTDHPVGGPRPSDARSGIYTLRDRVGD